jgi:hypothetical protein
MGQTEKLLKKNPTSEICKGAIVLMISNMNVNNQSTISSTLF